MKRRARVTLLSIVLVLPFSLVARAAGPAYPVTAVKQPFVLTNAATIGAAELRDYLSFVASDEMEGRADPSRGLDITARFIATMLSRAGVKPAGDHDSYFQRITLEREKVVAEGTGLEVDGTHYAYGKDFLARAPGGTASGPLVFAGDGWFVKSKGADPYREFDPKGKIVIITGGTMPPGMNYRELAAGRGGDVVDPAGYARQKGAAGIIVLQSPLVQSNPDSMQATRRMAEEGHYYPQKLSAPASGLPTIIATASLANAIFSGQHATADAVLAVFSSGGTAVKPFELTADRRVSFTVKTTTEKTPTQNVVAVVEGSDPTLKSEYVALGAHYDHIGICTPVAGDKICNGADDDGTGTVALLTMAEALMRAERHPKRSVLFVWHMGEEMGLWGSEYFTKYPTVPLDKIVAQLNIDMIGRSRPDDDTDPRDRNLSGADELYVIGSKMMSTELGNLSETVNADYLKLSFNYKYDDPKDPEQFFYRSDHFNYARRGIPIIFYFTGVHRDYHKPGDEVSKIDFEKYEKVARTVYVTMWEIAEAKTRLKVDKPLAAGREPSQLN